jgi:hypothetical protein
MLLFLLVQEKELALLGLLLYLDAVEELIHESDELYSKIGFSKLS